MAPLTTIIPKPLVPVGEMSILEVLVRQLVLHGLPSITISIGYLGHLIEAVIGDGRSYGAEVSYTRESTPLGTAGAVGLLDPMGDDDDLIVVNGDTLTNLNFRELIEHHRTTGAAATVGCNVRRVPSEFGVIEIGPTGELTGYLEKPVIESTVSMGVNVLSARVVGGLQPPRRIDMPDLFRELSARAERVSCFVSECVWLDLGRVDDVRAANEIFARERSLFLPT